MDIPADSSAALSMEQAQEAAENAIEGGIILLLKLEKEDKATVYDIKAVSDQGTLYELKIDAATGSVLEQEWED
jgi:uncharacterized membrane protein YkoI